jgi:hypothetical protein
MVKKSNNLVKLLYILAIILLVVGFVIFLLEKSQVTDFYSKPVTTQPTDTRPVNDVQYTPADPTDNDLINDQKADGTLDSPIIPPANGSPINVVLTASGQDEVGGPVIIKVLLTDVTNGACQVAMAKDGQTKNYTASVINAGTYYTCDGFEIPLTDLSVGDWVTTVTVTSTDRTGTAQQIIKVAN